MDNTAKCVFFFSCLLIGGAGYCFNCCKPHTSFWVHALKTMAFATQQDRSNLWSQNLWSDYQSLKPDFIALAKVVYTAIEGKMGSAPSEADVLNGLAKAILDRSATYAAMLQRRPFMNTSLYPAYADALARVMLDDEWPIIKT